MYVDMSYRFDGRITNGFEKSWPPRTARWGCRYLPASIFITNPEPSARGGTLRVVWRKADPPTGFQDWLGVGGLPGRDSPRLWPSGLVLLGGGESGTDNRNESISR